MKKIRKTEEKTIRVIVETAMYIDGWDDGFVDIDYDETMFETYKEKKVSFATEDIYFDADTKEYIGRGNWKTYHYWK